jgi:hypothetical protein
MVDSTEGFEPGRRLRLPPGFRPPLWILRLDHLSGQSLICRWRWLHRKERGMGLLPVATGPWGLGPALEPHLAGGHALAGPEGWSYSQAYRMTQM